MQKAFFIFLRSGWQEKHFEEMTSWLAFQSTQMMVVFRGDKLEEILDLCLRCKES